MITTLIQGSHSSVAIFSFCLFVLMFLVVVTWTFNGHSKEILNEKAQLPLNDEPRSFS